MRKLTTEEFIKRAREIHGNKYDYSKVDYKGSNIKVCIICPEHGEFWQKPVNHLCAKCGCPKCGFIKQCIKQSLGLDLFVKMANKIHNDKYDYSKVKYINRRTKVCIICPIHGEFWQTPSAHLSTTGCPMCGKSFQHTTATFIQRAREIHGDKYDYSKIVYVNALTPVCIICPNHGEFWQLPKEHLNNRCGCPKCKKSHMEEEISQFLKNNNIEFEEQKHFQWLGSQSLDFYLPEYNVGIECQGIQHFKEFKYFGGKEKFARTLELDERKRKLCEENKVKLIYYSNLNIEFPYQVITDKLNLFENIKTPT